jgi:hypothetical protein
MAAPNDRACCYAIANGEVFVGCASRYTGLCSPGGYWSVAMYELPAALKRCHPNRADGVESKDENCVR